MFEELEEFPRKDHFFFSAGDDLEKVCNAPRTGHGVFIVQELKFGRIEMVYIGASTKMQANGTFRPRSGGLWNGIVNGHDPGSKAPRKLSWPQKQADEHIDAFDVYWYVTFDRTYMGIPSFVEGLAIQRYYEVYGRLPRWNAEF